MSTKSLPIFDSPSNLFILMELFEEFTHLCHQNGISFWIDWGTELGALRHSNIIPWDIDCDTCLTEDNYQKLLKLFSDHQNTIGNLTCNPNGYNDPNGCCWIFNKKYLYLGKDIFGIDCVSYQIHSHQTKTLMSKITIDNCPATPSSYDYSNQELFPLQQILFVGNFVFTPAKSIELMKRYYGEQAYLLFPQPEFQIWSQLNSNRSFLLDCPFRTVPQVEFIHEGLQLKLPFVIRNSTEFNIDIEQLKQFFIQESQIISWFESKNELFVENLSNNSKDILDKWEKNQLTTNVTDSPSMHHQLLPQILRDRIYHLQHSYQSRALCYLLTNQNTLTKFHTDIGGHGWVYLKQGIKLWWFISPQDIQLLQQHNFTIEFLRDLSFTQLVFIHDYYLWGKIYVLILQSNDFVCFPEHWAHRVYTYEKAFGVSGYTSH